MSASSSELLQRAYELVEAGQPAEARAILEPLLEAEPRNADAWWIYSYAVEDPDTARNALKNVLSIDPDYPDAAALLSDLNAQLPEPAEGEQQEAATAVVPAAAVTAVAADHLTEKAADTPDAALILDEPDFLPPTPTAVPDIASTDLKKDRRGNGLLWAALIAAMLLVAVVWLLRRGGPETATVRMPTLDATGQALSSVDVTADVTIDANATEIVVIPTGSSAEITDEGGGSTGPAATLVVETPAATAEGAVSGTQVILAVTPILSEIDMTSTAIGMAVGPDASAVPTEMTALETEVAQPPTITDVTDEATVASDVTEPPTTQANPETEVAEATPDTSTGGPEPLELTATALIIEATSTAAGTPGPQATEVAALPTEAGVDPIALTATSIIEGATQTAGVETGPLLTATADIDAATQAVTSDEILLLTATAIIVDATSTADAMIATGSGQMAPDATAQPVDSTPTAEAFGPESTQEGVGGGAEITPDGTGGDPLEILVSTLEGAGLGTVQLQELQTELGSALITSVCAEEGPSLRTVLPIVMDASASQSGLLEDRFVAVGARIVSCADPARTLRLIVVERTFAEAFSAGGLTQAEFEAAWRSI